MTFTKLSWGMAALAVACQLAATGVLVAIFTLHPALVRSLPVRDDIGAAVSVAYHSEEEIASVDWELCDKEQP